MYTVQYICEKNVKTVAIIKWLHHANRISYLKPLKHNMNLVDRELLFIR